PLDVPPVAMRAAVRFRPPEPLGPEPERRDGGGAPGLGAIAALAPDGAGRIGAGHSVCLGEPRRRSAPGRAARHNPPRPRTARKKPVREPVGRNRVLKGLGALLVAAACLGASGIAVAQVVDRCPLYGPMPTFPRIPMCAFPGAYQDSSLIDSSRCIGSFVGPLPE